MSDNKKDSVIQCDICQHEWKAKDMDFKTVYHTFKNLGRAKIIYFRCKNCGKVYVVCILDYTAEKNQKKLLNLTESIRKKMNSGVHLSEARMDEMYNLEAEAMAYQKEILNTYKDEIPEDVFVN